MINKKTARTLEYDLILKMLGEKTVSESGRVLAENLMPTGDTAAAERLMEETREAETLLVKQTAHPVSSFDEPARELKRLATGAPLNCVELLRINTVFKAAMRTKKAVVGQTDGHLSVMAKKLFFEEHVMREIDECIIGENELADTASGDLFSIRRTIRRENEFIREKLKSITKSGELSKQLQDAIVTQRNGRYVVPVKAEYKGKLPGIVHAQSASGATLFVEPMSVVEANNRISELLSREAEEVARILARLSEEVRPVYRRHRNERDTAGNFGPDFCEGGARAFHEGCARRIWRGSWDPCQRRTASADPGRPSDPAFNFYRREGTFPDDHRPKHGREDGNP